MTKNQINKLPEYFEKYISYVPDIDLSVAMNQFGIEYLMQEKSMLTQIGHQVYAPEIGRAHV